MPKYLIGEFSHQTGYSVGWLRQLERRGILRPSRAGRIRVFDETDKARIVAYKNRRNVTPVQDHKHGG